MVLPRTPLALPLTTAVLFLACSEGSTQIYGAPPPDASDDTTVDVGADAATDTGTDVAADTHIDVADSGDASPDVCDTAEPPDGPCSPGERQRAWCGRCGRKQRVCPASGQWGEWGVCVEDPDAECSPCESATAPCGFCGEQPVWCDTSGEKCRWVRGACTGGGECAAGAYRREVGACESGLKETLWCGSDCTWGGSSGCGLGPRWEPIEPAPLAPRVDFVAIGSVLWGGSNLAGTEVFDDGASLRVDLDQWDAWPASGSATFPGRRAASVAAWDEGVLVFGGENGQGEVLGDGAVGSQNDPWSLVSPQGAPSPRSGATATAMSGPSILVYGGRSGFGTAAPGGAVYYPSTDSWYAIDPSPLGDRQEHSAVQDPVSGKVILWGGRSGEGEPPAASGAIYDPTKNTWSSMADAPIRRTGHTALWEPTTSRMFVLFGEDGTWPGHRGDGASYDPVTDSWSWLPDVSSTGVVPTRGTAVIVNRGAVWVVAENRAARLDAHGLTWAAVPAPPDSVAFRRGWARPDLDGKGVAAVVWGPPAGHVLLDYPYPLP